MIQCATCPTAVERLCLESGICWKQRQLDKLAKLERQLDKLAKLEREAQEASKCNKDKSHESVTHKTK